MMEAKKRRISDENKTRMAASRVLSPLFEKIGTITARAVFFDACVNRGVKSAALANESTLLADDALKMSLDLETTLAEAPDVSASSRSEDVRTALTQLADRLRRASANL